LSIVQRDTVTRRSVPTDLVEDSTLITRAGDTIGYHRATVRHAFATRVLHHFLALACATITAGFLNEFI